jgi:dipeptidyl aminopeptidase/acylaminoacyl peptidase
MPTVKGPVRRIVPADGWLSQVSLDDSREHLAFLRGDLTRPADVWVLDHPLKEAARGKDGPLQPALRQVTFSLMGGVRSKELSGGDFVTYKSFDGKAIHALVVKPRVLRLGSSPPKGLLTPSGSASRAAATAAT